MNNQNVCIFSHYDRHSHVRDYVHFYIQSLISAGFQVIFVSTADEVRPADRQRLEEVGAEVHTRENKGLDFGSWQFGLGQIGDTGSLDKLILANDSVFGPLFDLSFLIDQMERTGADFWGITDSYEIAWHLQSYFLAFDGKVVRSKTFKTFFEADFQNQTKRQIISGGEIGLSQALIQAGFRGAASCPYGLLVDDAYDGPRNPTHYHWDRLIEELRCPFLKIQLLRDNPRSIGSIGRWQDVISNATDYDVGLIEGHIAAFGEGPAKQSLMSTVWWYACRIPWVFGLALRALLKAAKHPIRAEMALEQFVASDLSQLPPHPAPQPKVAYAQFDNGVRRTGRLRPSGAASEAAE